MKIGWPLLNLSFTQSLTALRSADPAVRSFAAQVVAKIALIELPQQQWNDLIQMLLGNMTSSERVPDELRQSTLETVGYICEEINPQVLAPVADKILTAIIQGIDRSSRPVLLK